MDGCDGTPDCRVDRPPAHGSLRMAPGTNIPAARSRSGLWSGFHPTHARHGYSRSTNFAAVTMANAYAERLIGSIRRECVDHIVVFGERHLRHALLSYMNYYNSNTSVVRQRCSGITCGSCRRPDSSEADSRRSPPRVRPDLICGRDTSAAKAANAKRHGNDDLAWETPFRCHCGGETRGKSAAPGRILDVVCF
jgi:hypothetical protein